MIRGGFLTPQQRHDLTALARKAKVEHRIARRANALVMLDRGKSCEEVAEFLLLDDDTVRTWHDQFHQTGIKGVSEFHGGGSLAQLTETQMVQLRDWVVSYEFRRIPATYSDRIPATPMVVAGFPVWG